MLLVYPVFFFLFRNFRKVRKTNYKIVGIECRNVVGGKVDKFSLRENILDVNPSRLLKFIVFIIYIWYGIYFISRFSPGKLCWHILYAM